MNTQDKLNELRSILKLELIKINSEIRSSKDIFASEAFLFGYRKGIKTIINQLDRLDKEDNQIGMKI